VLIHQSLHGAVPDRSLKAQQRMGRGIQTWLG